MAVTQFDYSGPDHAPELEYVPHAPDLLEFVRSTNAARVLLVGGGEIVDIPAPDTRIARVPTSVAANGTYVFRSGATTHVMICRGGNQPGDAVAGYDLDFPNDHPLILARGWFD